MATSIEIAIMDAILNNIFRQDIMAFIAISFIILLFVLIHLGLPQTALIVPIFVVLMIFGAWITAINVLLGLALGVLIAIFFYFLWTGVTR